MRRQNLLLILLFLGGFIFSPFINAAFTQSCDPFSIQCRKTEQILNKYTLTELHMVGSIAQSGKIWAIIKIPNGHVYPVTVGEEVGIEGGHVVQIMPEQLTIQGKNIFTLTLDQVR